MIKNLLLIAALATLTISISANINSSFKTLEEQSKGLYLLKVNANGTTQEFKVFKE